jgi:hypothetical protein
MEWFEALSKAPGKRGRYRPRAARPTCQSAKYVSQTREGVMSECTDPLVCRRNDRKGGQGAEHETRENTTHSGRASCMPS